VFQILDFIVARRRERCLSTSAEKPRHGTTTLAVRLTILGKAGELGEGTVNLTSEPWLLKASNFIIVMIMFSKSIQANARYDTLDGMRGIAAISVMINHFTVYAGFTIFEHASLSVDVFFILSGFVIFHSYGNRLKGNMTAVEYVLRRIIRLYPMFIAGLLIGTPILYFVSKARLSTYFNQDIIDASLHNYFFIPYINNKSVYNLGAFYATVGEIFPINPPAWSLFFELVASISFIFLYNLKPIWLVIIVVVSYIALVSSAFLLSVESNTQQIDLAAGWGTTNFLGGFPRVFFGFTFGLFIYSISSDNKYSAFRQFVQKHFNNSYLNYALLVLIFWFPRNFRGLYEALILLIVAPGLVFAGSAISLRQGFTMNLAKQLGRISYPVYCLHFPIGRAVFLMMSGSYYLNLFPALVASAITLAVSLVLTEFYDEPVRRSLSKMLHSSIPSTR
jgi:peptidoglycan/LPS O-acetylase OafA/YrhL